MRPVTRSSLTAPGSATVRQVSLNLGTVVLAQASAMHDVLGFGWIGRADAPSTFPALQRAFVASQASGCPLPVSNQNSGSTIYDDVEPNLAFRFWHDATHVLLDCGFDLDSELTVAVAHLDVLRAYGFGPGSMEHALLHADTVGQAICVATVGAFPEDQACSVRTSLERGLGPAVRTVAGWGEPG